MSTHFHKRPIGRMEERLRCEECGREADERARGWRALHGSDVPPDDELETFVFCPQCADEQFGPQRARV